LAIRGETLGSYENASFFNYHVLNTKGAPMIHATYSKRPELVLFGSDIHLTPQFFLNAGNSIIVSCVNGQEDVKVSRLNSLQSRIVTTRLDEIIKAIVDLGGTYPDVVQMLLEAQAEKALPCRLEIDKLPQGGRTYSRSTVEGGEDIEEKTKKSFWGKINPNSWVEAGNEDWND